MAKRKFFIFKEDFIDDVGEPAKAGSIVLFEMYNEFNRNEFWGYYFNERINKYDQLLVEIEFVEPIARENIDKTILRELEVAYQRFLSKLRPEELQARGKY